MIQAYASGQASKLAVQKGALYQLHDLNNDFAPRTVSSAELRMLFANCLDVEKISSPTLEDALAHANSLADADRALRYFVILISPESSGNQALKSIAETLDWLLENTFAYDVVRNNLFSRELPNDIDHQSIRGLTSNFTILDKLFDEIFSHQIDIRKVRLGFDAIAEHHFDTDDHKSLFKESAIRSGCFYKLAVEPVNKALFDIYRTMSHVPNNRDIIQEWTKSFEISHSSIKLDLKPEEEFDRDDVRDRARNGAGGHQIFENVKAQQRAVLNKIQVGDIAKARRFAEELVATQKQSGEPEHLSKSLCQLSQFAKEHEIYELELEWAQQATKILPSDARSHSQMGDALIRLHRYTEANEALEKASAFGEVRYALNGKARIQRAIGHLDDAESLFLELLERFPSDPKRVFAIAGLAEIARDRGDLNLAIQKYLEAISIAPFDPAFRNGLAATYAQMGNFPEALSQYQTSLSYNDNEVVTLNGIAAVYKTKGDFVTAEEKLLEIIKRFPHDPFSRSTLGDLYKLQGKFEDAHRLLEKACNELPFSPQPLIGLANTYSEWGKFERAQEIYSRGMEKFPYEAIFTTGLAYSYKKSGQYQSALSVFDEARKKFPHDRPARLGRADMLRRMGQIEDALKSYTKMWEEDPSDLPTCNALASILIHQGKFTQAKQYLIEKDAQTQDEWRSKIINGMIFVKQKEFEVAEKHFEELIKKTPFARERRFMKAILASINIRRKNYLLALRNAEGVEGEITELIRLHALAGSRKMNKASDVLAHFRSKSPEFFPEIREEIAAQFGMNDNSPLHDHNWLVTEEQNILLLEAA